MSRRVGVLLLSLSLLPCLLPAAGAVDCHDILGNQVAPCGFESAAEVAAWNDTLGASGTAVFAAGVGQNGGAIDGTADIGVPLGFRWARRSPCFPVSAGQVLSIGYSARLLSESPIQCFVGRRWWEDAGCTVTGGGGLFSNTSLVTNAGYTSILHSTTVPLGNVAMQVSLWCQGDYEFQVRADNVFAAPVASSGCLRNEETACLHAGRFEVQVDWQTRSDSGEAEVMSFGGERAENDESVFFWFFNPQNFEMGVKVLKACVPSLGNKYWVFTSGLTNQGWTVRVRDTYTDAMRTYENPVGQLSETFADTGAFDCP